MRKDKSWTRQEYDQVYQSLRRGVDVEWFVEYFTCSNLAIKAADYSYQAYGYEVTGWISDRRRRRFYQILYRILTQSEGVPF